MNACKFLVNPQFCRWERSPIEKSPVKRYTIPIDKPNTCAGPARHCLRGDPMKRLSLMLVLGAVLFSAFLTPAPARAALSFEDPQLCINGKLLRVDPTTAGIEVWVRVAPNMTVDFNVANCGGNPALPAVDADHVYYNGKTKWIEALVKTEKHTNVIFTWDGKTVVKNSGKDFWVYAKTKIK